jgi:glycine/D-amino acid oxidase-like deaminating enzyme
MTSDIIIIGGGIVGASFAYHAHLNRINKISVITDALPGDEQQATSNTWGWVNGYANNDEEYALFRLASLNYWPQLIERIDKTSITSKGAFFWDLADVEILQTIDQHQNWGHSVTIKQESELEKLLPNLFDKPKNAGYGNNDLALEATEISKKLFEKSHANFLNKKVTGLIFKQNQVVGVQVGEEKIYADEIVLATGLGTSEILKSIDINFKMRTSLGLLAYTNPLPPLLKHPITGNDFHVRQDNRGRLVIGGRFDDDATKEKDLDKVAKMLVEEMASRLNYKGEIILAHFTVGKRPLPIDGRPKIGRLKNSLGEIIKGVYIAVMHSGVTNAPIAGKLGIEEIISGKQDKMLNTFSPQMIRNNS